MGFVETGGTQTRDEDIKIDFNPTMEHRGRTVDLKQLPFPGQLDAYLYG